MLNSEAVEKIFRVFARRFGYKFRTTFEDSKARELWLYDLRKAGISNSVVNVALEQCRELEWPPSVGEFLKYCRVEPQTAGAPSLDCAFAEAERAVRVKQPLADDRWSHPCVCVAAKIVGAETIRTDINAREKFGRQYAITLRRYLDGQPLAEDELPALAAPFDRPPDFEKGRQAVAALRQIIGRRSNR